MMKSSIAVEVQQVDKSFATGNLSIQVLKQVDFTAYMGEMMMLIGPSGCGKTTLLSLIAATMRADRGSTQVFGNQLEKMSHAQLTRFRAEKIGFVFQQFNLIPTINIAENVLIPLMIQGCAHGKAMKKAREILDLVGLGDRWKEFPNKLSGGQQQRVAIARALVHQPPLVICDEPTAALDAKNGEVVMDLFKTVACSADRAVIIVTHDNRIYSYADRISRMDDGEIVETKIQHETARFIHEHAH